MDQLTAFIASWLAYLIGAVIGGIICGVISKSINESKGYQGGFAWGFWFGVIGIIVVAVKPNYHHYDHSSSISDRQHKLENISSGKSTYVNTHTDAKNDWRCPNCGSVNPHYTTTCDCGCKRNVSPSSSSSTNVVGNYSTASTTQKKNDIDLEEFKKLKSLLDDGIITEEEYNTKKKEFLNL